MRAAFRSPHETATDHEGEPAFRIAAVKILLDHLLDDRSEKPILIEAMSTAKPVLPLVLAYGSGPVADPRKEMVFPDNRPYFAKILADNRGRIYILKLKPVLETNSIARADVFSRDGIFLYRLTIPVRPSLIKAGFLYEMREDKQAGEFQIIKHRIKNWDRLQILTP
jgi:hypothetical protein